MAVGKSRKKLSLGPGVSGKKFAPPLALVQTGKPLLAAGSPPPRRLDVASVKQYHDVPLKRQTPTGPVNVLSPAVVPLTARSLSAT